MEVEEWVEEKIEEGEPVEDIRRELSDAGWSDEDIDLAIRQARKGEGGGNHSQNTQTNGGWRNYLVLAGLLLLSGIVGFLLVTALTTYL